MTSNYRWSSPEYRVERCAECGEERPFEQPPCADHLCTDHSGADGADGAGCPEWVCVDCGSSVLLGLPYGIGLAAA